MGNMAFLMGNDIPFLGIGKMQRQIDFRFQDSEDKGGILNQEYGYIVSHCGYADAELFKLTSFSTCRVKDLECMTSDAVKSWVKENNIELASFKDLPEEWIQG